MSKRHLLLPILAAVALVTFVSGCAWTSQAGELRHERRSIALGDAESVAVDVKMGAGDLTIAGGAKGLVDATFTYNVADWRPIMDYRVSEKRGDLLIQQPQVKRLGLESYRYAWDLRLNDAVPMALDVALGAGESVLDVGALDLTRLDMKVGVGGGELDLQGQRERDLKVTIRGGMGEATVLLPDDVGVKAEVSGGLGEVDVEGLMREGDVYVNEAYGESDATIILDIQGGVGGVNLKVAG
jgi:hypothetical protein